MKKSEKNIPVSIAMPQTLARRIRVLAAQENKSRSQLVRDVLEELLHRLSEECKEGQHD